MRCLYIAESSLVLMTQLLSSRWLGMALLVFSLGTGAARADSYSDVTDLARQGNGREALIKADAYIASHPRDPQMRFLRGVILANQGNKTEALAVFSELTRDFPELPEPYNNLATIYASEGKFDQARDALETAIKRNPSYSTAYENLGDVYARLAGQAYGHAQQLSPGDGGIPPKLALVRQLTGGAATAQTPAALPPPPLPAPTPPRKPVKR